MKWSSAEQIWGFYGTFYPFFKFYYLLFFYPFLFLTQVIISFLYFSQIKCNFLLLLKALLCLKLLWIYLINVTDNFLTLIPNFSNWAKIKLIFMNNLFFSMSFLSLIPLNLSLFSFLFSFLPFYLHSHKELDLILSCIPISLWLLPLHLTIKVCFNEIEGNSLTTSLVCSETVANNPSFK